MGNPAGFDLNQSIATWREALLARDSVTTDRARELETHLRDTFAELVAKGLPAEEAFHLAARRLGSAGTLAAEFDKQDPAAKWSRRVFWMLAGLLASSFWNGTLAPIRNLIQEATIRVNPSTHYVSLWFQLWTLASSASLAGVFLLLARGRLTGLALALGRRIHSRGQMAAILTGLYGAMIAFQFIFPRLWQFLLAGAGSSYHHYGTSGPANWAFLGTTLVWPALIIFLLVRLAPLPAFRPR